jgi:adenosine kinase
VTILSNTLLAALDKTPSASLSGCYRSPVPPHTSVPSALITAEKLLVRCAYHAMEFLYLCSSFAEKCASQDGVNVAYQKHATVPTGTCAVLVHGGERSLIANLAAANTFSVDHLDVARSMDVVQAARIIYVTGFFLTVSVETILRLAKHSVENNKTFVFNLSAPFLIQFFADQMASVMPYADFVFGNEVEAATYGTAKGYGTDLSEIALKLAAEPKASGTRPRIVIFTQGASETIVACEGKVTSFPVDALPRELLVDTNGAGDAFVGGFLSQLALGKPISECVRAGNYAARVIIQHSGCTFPKECGFI